MTQQSMHAIHPVMQFMQLTVLMTRVESLCFTRFVQASWCEHGGVWEELPSDKHGLL